MGVLPTPAQDRACPASAAALHALHQATRAPAWSLATSRPSGTRCRPSRLPLAVRPRNGTGALALALAGLHAARTSQAGGQMARAAAFCPLPPLPAGLGSGSRAPTHRRRCCTRSAARAGAPSLSLSLTLTLGRPLRFVFLPLLVAPSLHSLSSSSQPSLHVLDNPHPSHARPPSLVPRVRMNLPHSWSVSSLSLIRLV